MFKWIKEFFFPDPLPERSVYVVGFTLHIVDYGELQRIHRKHNPKSANKVNGLTLVDRREIWVAYDQFNDMHKNRLPMLETLGHEICHLPELFNHWHR